MERSGWLKVNRRVVLFFLAWLVLFDIGVRMAEASYLSSQVRRLPADDRATLSLWKSHLEKSQGFKVVFLGDSVVHGGGVREEKDTLPAGLERDLRQSLPGRDIEVFNFSLPGCTPADAYVISRFIAGSEPDLVIYDGNLGWFGNQRVMEHPGLVALPGVDLSVDQRRMLQASVPAADRESRIADAVGSVWALYRDRIFLNYWWWGQPYREKIKLALRYKSVRYLLPHAEDQAPDKVELYRPWYEKDFTSLQASRSVLGSVVLNQANPQWVMYRSMLAMWRSRGVPVAVFMVPRNHTLLERYQVINRQRFSPNLNLLKEAARASGVLVYDYTSGVVDDRQFSDTVHPTAAGNRLLADRLARDLMASHLVR